MKCIFSSFQKGSSVKTHTKKKEDTLSTLSTIISLPNLIIHIFVYGVLSFKCLEAFKNMN